MKTEILCIGDSITDCDHCFTRDNLGDGYVKMLSELLRSEFIEDAYEFPGAVPETVEAESETERPGHEVQVINGGTDGFTFPRILQKWKQNYQEKHFDIVIITGGINEVGAMLHAGLAPEDAEAYLAASAEALRSLISQLSEGTVRTIILIEPFLLPASGYQIHWLPYLESVRRTICNVAAKFNEKNSIQEQLRPDCAEAFLEAPRAGGRVQILQVQKPLEALAERIGLDNVTTDGIHPAAAGHRLIAELVCSEIRKILLLYEC